MEKLLDLVAVADILGISPVTAKIWASKRRLPVIKVGRLVRIAPGALEEWIRKNAAKTSTQGQISRPRAPQRAKTTGFKEVLEELSREGPRNGRKS
jgi:excisionase family DNA binding protein